MASFSIKQDYKSNDKYNTSYEMWEAIKQYIPKNKVLWEAFLLNNSTTKSLENLRDLGFDVLGDTTIDFFDSDMGDVIVSNPPYSLKVKIFKRLALLDKPFILILPIATITKQFTKVLERRQIQLIVPTKRLHFIDGEDTTKRNWFDTCYFCYKIGLEYDITFI